MSKTIEFTDEERRAIVTLIDMAVKSPSGGVRIAQPAAILASKFADYPAEASEEVEDEDVEDAS